MTTFYSIQEDIRALQSLMESTDSTEDAADATAQIVIWWHETEGALEDKIERVLSYAAEQQRLAEAAKSEAARLGELAATRNRRAERLQAAVKHCLDELGRDRVQTPRFDVATVKNGGKPAVIIDNEKYIPSEYWITKTETVVDKRYIGQKLAAGLSVPGCRLAPPTTRLRVK